MATPLFDRETWLDISVNIIPLVIVGFFIALFTVKAPWSLDGLGAIVGYALLVVPIVLLAYVTYVTANAIEATEE